VAVLRQTIGETLRSIRLRQRRTLREVSTAARVSLGYLSEIERGQKEPSSELLAAICAALDVSLSELFREVSDSLYRAEVVADRTRIATTAPSGPSASLRPALNRQTGPKVRAGSTVAA
jgi:transcriptional regulator with XRE-family HTH domain